MSLDISESAQEFMAMEIRMRAGRTAARGRGETQGERPRDETEAWAVREATARPPEAKARMEGAIVVDGLVEGGKLGADEDGGIEVGGRSVSGGVRSVTLGVGL